MSRWNLSFLLGLVAVGLVSLSLAFTVSGQAKTGHENIKLLVDVLGEVKEKYVKELSPEKMRELVENMINGGLEQLDPHSQFINADEFKQFQAQNKGKFGGIGIRIRSDRGFVFVETPIVGTPAYEAGILAGDLIVKVDGKSIENSSMKKVVDLIQGEPGTNVTLTVLHDGAKKPVDVEVTRAEIKIDSVLGEHRNPINLEEWDFWIDPDVKIGYVRIVQFTETTTEELIRVVDALKKLGMRGLVVDLRNNPGGLLRAAVEVSSLFLPEGKRVVTTKSRGGREEAYNARSVHGHDGDTSFPLAILINRNSASASEIVASALQDHLRAVIIGERSYGKGSVQNVIMMENNRSALKLTTASYWRPSGRNIHRFPDAKKEDEWGVKPNQGYEIELVDGEGMEYAKYRRDRDIVRRPGQAPPPKKEESKKGDKKSDKKSDKKEPFKDRVLDKAVEYIRGELKKGDNAQGAAPGLTPRPAFGVPPLPPPGRNAETPAPAFDAAAWANPTRGALTARANT